MKMANGRRILVILGALASGACAVGCELIVEFDRSLIDAGGGSVDGSFVDAPSYQDVTFNDNNQPDVPADVPPVDANEGGMVDSGSDANDGGVDSSGTDAADAADVLGASLLLAPSTFPYADTMVGLATADQTFTVTNNGGAASGVPTVSKTGANPGDFVVAANGCTTAVGAGGGTCTISVHFAPSIVGSEAATLQVAATPGGTPTASLSGNGTGVTISPTSFDFMNQGTGTSSGDVTFTVTNNGSATTGTLSVAYGGTNATDFSTGATDTCSGQTLAASTGSCTLAIKFTPGAMGPRSGNVTVSAASPGGSTAAALAGTGT